MRSWRTEPEGEEARRFDLLLLFCICALLRAEPSFVGLHGQLEMIAGLLEAHSSIPMLNAQTVLIREIRIDECWQDVTAFMLEGCGGARAI